MRRIGVALVGAGSIADYHLGGLAHVPEADVRVVASRTLASARAAASRHGVADTTDDIAAVLRRTDVGAVVIATPDDTHEALAIEALRAGRPVMVQKPMATTSAACRRMIAVAMRTGADLQVSWMHRHFEEVPAALALIADGAIGAVTSLRQRNATPGPDWGDWFFRREAISGGVVHQLGIHGVDLIEHMFGPIRAVSARTATLLAERRLRDGRVVAVENPDWAQAIYELAGGTVASHEMSMIEAAGTDRFRMEIFGATGTLWLRSERGALAVARGGRGWAVQGLPDEPLGRRHHRTWIDGLLGRAPKEETALAGLRSLLVAEAVVASAARGGARVEVEAV